MRTWVLALVISISLAQISMAAPPQREQGTAGAQSSSPTIQTVFIILMENQNWNSSVPGTFTSSNAPYIMNTIVPAGAYANNYIMVSGNQGPSEANYKWLEAGSDFNDFSNDDPSTSNSISSTQHLTTYLDNAGITWKAYIENIDGTECPLVSNVNSLSSATTVGGGSANYYAKHNPFVFFDDLTNDLSSTSATCIDHIRPYSELATDLANGTVARYNFIVPNGTDDMHDSDITTGDTWLSQNVPTILNSSAYKNNGAIFIVWDESATDAGTQPLFVLSPLVKSAGYSNSIQYSHSSTLLTMQEIFGVGPCLADACNATDLSDLFQPGVISPLTGITVAINPTSATLTPSQQQQFTATVTGNTNTTAVNWTISPTNAGIISSSGLYTAPSSISTAQTVDVTATSQANDTQFDTVSITLQPAQSTPVASTMTSPAPGSTLAGTSTTFTWTTGASGTTGYYLWIGSSLGAHDVANLGEFSTTSATVNLPIAGAKLYFRLWTVYNSTTLLYNDYVYTEPAPAAMTSPAPGAALSGASTTFQWTAGFDATGYFLWIGSSVGAHDLANLGEFHTTNATVTLPAKGAAIYVRLWSVVNGRASQYSDYTYTEVDDVSATMTSPVSGSTLSGASTTFQWTAGSNVTGYYLWIGSALGAHDLANLGEFTTTSATVTLPTTGATIYVRLWSVINGRASQYIDYAYTEANTIPAAMTSPVSGSMLSGASTTFQWTTGSNVTGYYLWIGTSPGAHDLANLGEFTTTSATVTLPTNGATIYVRLWSVVNGRASLYGDYAYAEASQ
jgi:Phosphoesterase family